ncbi:uncharacterized protein [Penaeus vannamei]|uniref:uncharacterized protein n=1 Tax=Penaeus vannamei TaxID=6689 RepID=UPI00387FB05C
MILMLFRYGPKILSLFTGCLLGSVTLLPMSQAVQNSDVAGVVLREASRKHRAFTVFAYTHDNCTSYDETMLKFADLRTCEGQYLSGVLISLCNESMICSPVASPSEVCLNITIDDKCAAIKFPATEDIVMVPGDVTVMNWTQSGNTSALVVKWNKHMLYKLRLRPFKSPQEYTEIDGFLYQNSSLIFQVEWDNLEYVNYYAYVVLFNYCEDKIAEFQAPDLHYVPEVTQPDKDTPERSWVDPLLIVLAVAVAGVLGTLVCRGRRPGGRLCRSPEGAAASGPPPPVYPTQPPPAAAAPSKAALLVYPKDVIPQAKELLQELREKSACEILDLHDVYDFDKLHDSTAWLVRTLRNPAVLKILVVSEEGKRLQDLHRSSVRIPVQDGDLERFSDAEGGRGSGAGSRSLRQGLEGDLSPLVLPESRNKDCESCPRPGKKGCILPGGSTRNQRVSDEESSLAEEDAETALGFLYDYMIRIQESSCLSKNNLVYKAQFADGPLDRVTDCRLFLLPRQTHFLVQAINAFVAGE